MPANDTHSLPMDYTKRLAADRSAKLAGVWLAGCIAVLLAVQLTVLKAFALIGVAVSGWLLVYHGATSASYRLTGAARFWFSVVASVAFPALLSFYFLRGAHAFSWANAIRPVLSPWFLLPVVVIGAASMGAAEQMDRDHPVRAYLIAALVLWCLCFTGYNGIRLGGNDYDDYYDDTYQDPAQIAADQEGGRYFGQFIAYVAISYGAMTFKIVKMRRKKR